MANNASSGSTIVTSTSLPSVPPPSALPTFVTASGSNMNSQSPPTNMFHQTSFRPEIPENQNDSDISTEVIDEDVISNGNSWMSWIRDTVNVKAPNLLNKVAEKAKSSVDTVLTTLDPQMKDFMNNGCDGGIIVASDKEVEVNAVRDAFQLVFNRSSTRGFEVDGIDVPKQVVGFEAAHTIANLKIETMQKQLSLTYPIISIQSFIVEITPEKWYDLDLIILQQPDKNLLLETYTEMVPISQSVVNILKEDSQSDYKFKELGFNIGVSQIMGTNLQVLPSEWQETLTGTSRRNRIFGAAKTIANLYKKTLS